MQVIFSFYEEVEVMNDTLLFFAMKYDGNFREIFHAIEMKEPIDQQILKKYKKQVRHKYVTIIDNRYPDYFKKVECPPIVLFYKGNLDLIDKGFPMEYSVLESGKRFISTINPIEQNGKIVFDYIVGAECQEDLDRMLEHIEGKGLLLKNYDKSKIKQMER